MSCQERRPWSHIEQNAVRQHLGNYFVMKKLPGKLEIETAKCKAGAALSQRPWKQIKYFIKNHKKVCC